MEVDIALDLLSAKLNTEKEILKRELNFQTEEEFEQVGETSLNSVSIFQDIVTSNIVQNNFEISENEKEILSLNSDYEELISTLKNDTEELKESLSQEKKAGNSPSSFFFKLFFLSPGFILSGL